MAIKIYLEDVLKARGMTSKQLCALIGITEANLSILRSGKAKGVRFGTLNKICGHLECSVGDILKFDGNMEDNDEEYSRNRGDHKRDDPADNDRLSVGKSRRSGGSS